MGGSLRDPLLNDDIVVAVNKIRWTFFDLVCVPVRWITSLFSKSKFVLDTDNICC